LEGMPGGFGLVDFDAESWRRWRVTYAALDTHRCDHDLIAPGDIAAHYFLYKIVRRGEGDLGGGRHRQRPLRIVAGHRHQVRFRLRGNPPSLADAPAMRDIRLKDGAGALLAEFAE